MSSQITGGGLPPTGGTFTGLVTFSNGSSQTLAPTLAVGNAVASGATIAPTAPVTHVTGTAAVATITAPASFAASGKGGMLILIPDGAFTTNTTGNIALASTAVVGKALIMTYDNATSKWYPSY